MQIADPQILPSQAGSRGMPVELYLMQHGASLPEELDADRPLSPVGRDSIAKSARAMKLLGLDFDAILASPKTRAQQSAALAAQVMRRSELETALPVQTLDELGPTVKAARTLDALKDFAGKELADVALLLVGHLPNLELLAGLLVCSSGKLSLRVDNAGLTRIDTPRLEAGAGQLVWHLSPFHLQLLAG